MSTSLLSLATHETKQQLRSQKKTITEWTSILIISLAYTRWEKYSFIIESIGFEEIWPV